MSQVQHYITPIEDRISFFQKFIYGLGSLCNQLLTAVMSVLIIVLNIGLGMNPILVGTIMSIPRFIDALIDPIMGYITDVTKSKWGRRKPYIFIGAILSGLLVIFMWQIPAAKSEMFYFRFFTIGSILFYFAYTIYAAPFVALGYELTPDYHERTRLMSMSNTVGQFAWTLTPWLYGIMWNSGMHQKFVNYFMKILNLSESWRHYFIYTNMVDATKAIAIGIGILLIIIGVLPAIFVRERYYKIAIKEEEQSSENKNIISNSEDKIKINLIFILELCVSVLLILNGYKLLTQLDIFFTGLIFILAGILNTAVLFIRKSVKNTIYSQFAIFFKNFIITFKNFEFLKLCTVMFLIFNGFQLIAGLAPYNIIYYIYGGDPGKASNFMCWFFTISSVMTMCVIPIISWISSKVGKRNAFYISTLIAIFGYAIKWYCYEYIGKGSVDGILAQFSLFGMQIELTRPYVMLLCAPFIGFSLGGLFTLVGAMMGDVCDHDELKNGHRREGLFGAVNWWVVKLGMAGAFFLSGHLLNLSGFDVKLGGGQPVKTLILMRAYEVGIPIVTSIIAMIAMASYNITEEKAHSIRQDLEKRRGKV